MRGRLRVLGLAGVVILAVGCVFFPAEARAADESLAPKSLHGVAWGATIEQAAEVLGDLRFDKRACTDVRALGETWCAANFDLGPVGSYSDFRFGDGRFVGANIHFSATAFPYVLGLFTEKYGPQTSQRTETVQTIAGATLQCEVVTWNFRDVSIELRHYGAKVTEGSATFMTTAWQVGAEERAAAERKRAKDSF